MVLESDARMTALEGELTDQAMLQGLLGQLGSLGLDLVSVTELP